MRVEHGGYDTVSKAQLRTRHWGSYNTHTNTTRGTDRVNSTQENQVVGTEENEKKRLLTDKD